MYTNDNIIMTILDMAQELEKDQLESLICMLEDFLEEGDK